MSMLDAARPQRTALDLSGLLASRWLWCLAAVLCIAFREIAGGYSGLLTALGDPDDATRLHQVRTLMATGAWFDMALPRIGGVNPLVSHWSRLIDVPLIVLLQGLGLVLPPAAAELVTRIAWPLVLLFVFLRLVVRAAEEQSRQSMPHATYAGGLMLFMAVTCGVGLAQFQIGRIDHHNAMILGSIGGLLILLQARKSPAAGTLSGLLIGFSLAVGYEPLAFLLPALGGIALWSIVDMTWLAGVRRMAVAAASLLAAVFVTTVAPWHWLAVRCDALSLNMVLLVVAGAAGLSIIDRHGRHWRVAERLAALAGAGSLGLAGFGALDLRCLAGPFGQIAPEIKPIWLDHVTETASVFTFFHMNPSAVLFSVFLMVAALMAAAERWRRLKTPETLALLSLLVLITPAGLWMIKLTPYACWVAAFAVALSIADLGPTIQMTALSRQLGAALMINQWTITAAVAPFLAMTSMAPEALKGHVVVEGTECLTTPAISPLQALPKGFFVGPIEYGSYIVALTQHDVLAAPYHRADRAIIENQAILTAEPAEARRRLAAVSADYLLLCLPKMAAAKYAGASPQTSAPFGLQARLLAGQSLEFLQPLAIETSHPDLKVWRIVH
jgi:hypothetical protein